ncbi:MAG: hypothetical protein KAH48_11860, partial [Chlorobi bacterium]|nr:hypothetical protein [Chlorobiota bacterium]
GDIIKGAIVKLYFKDVKIGMKIVEGEGVKFEDLCEGAYTAVIIAEGYQDIEFRFELDCNEVKEIHKDMVSNGQKDSCCDGKIYIVPKDADSGEKLRYALVRLYFNGKKIAEKKSGEGYVMFEDLCEGKYGVDILAEGYKNIEFHVELSCNEEKELHKELQSDGNKDSCCNGVIYYILKEQETKKPIVEAKIRLYDNDEKLAEKYTNRDGVVIFTNVCEGKHQISSLRGGYVDFEFNFDVKCNDTLEIHRTMVPEDKDSCCTAILKIIILDRVTLKPLSYAKVVVEGKYFREEGKTNADGLVIFDGLCAPREYVVIASREGYQAEDLRVEFLECNKQIKTIKLQKK